MLASIFVVSVAGILFTYAGYPIVLAFAARWFPKPILREPCAAPVTIVIVAYNEAARIAGKIRSCLAQDHPGIVRVLVASDGSDDGTNEIVEALDHPNVYLFGFPERRGKAACLNDAVAACGDDFLVFTDVRQPLERDAVSQLLANFADPTIGAVSGELAFEADSIEGFGEGMDVYWRYEKFIRQKESAIGSVVGVSGALYALRRSLWKPIPSQTILDDVMIPMNVVMRGKRVVFEPRALAWDRPSTEADQEQRRKVRTLAGNFQLFALRPDFLLPGHNPLFVQMLCHKVLRLLVPLLMVTALLSSALLARHHERLWVILLAAQLCAYALAAAGIASAALRRWRPIRLLAAFSQLNLFAVLGFIEFVSNKDAHRWRSK